MLFLFPFCYQNGMVQSLLVVLLRFFLCTNVLKQVG